MELEIEHSLEQDIIKKLANQTIPRRLIQHPTIDVVLNERGVSTVFFHLDKSKGHHQGELKESSRKTTTFSTHIGLYRRRGLITERDQRLKYPKGPSESI
ncbi:hypothetical protein P5673_017967 [Acropora cervicornis]|uniref:Uncharacterized protein n=1 Tax=Acropora cervicornis TaxID=6130 RepID=A0AAD9QDJ5_ACRCE|nr:hypothetical protein P5673_017967 [Acropora cervicornis]